MCASPVVDCCEKMSHIPLLRVRAEGRKIRIRSWISKERVIKGKL